MANNKVKADVINYDRTGGEPQVGLSPVDSDSPLNNSRLKFSRETL